MTEIMEKARMFPKSVPFIQIYALCERYSSIGVAAILAIFISDKIGLNEDTSTAIVHFYYFAAYIFGIPGAIIADNFLGRFKTLLYGMSVLGGIGNVVLTIGTIEYLDYLLGPFTIIGLILISFGAGCLEPNLPAFSGDQYKLPLESKGFSLCIGLLFVMQNAARIIALVLLPYLRSKTQCFGAAECYPLIFGIFVMTKLIAITSILICRKFAVINLPSGNMFVKVCGCIWNAIVKKIKSKKAAKKSHWLDYSEEKYGAQIVSDTKRVVRVLGLLPPLVIVATLYFQQATRWVFQSRQMDGTVGNYVIKPDQVPLVNAISVVFFVPLCEYVFNPLLSKVWIKTNLHRVIFGGVISATAFVVAAIIQFQVERREPHSMHMVWQIPQHMMLALGEVFVYVQILQFGYTQAPIQMKSVLQAFFSMIIGGGNLIVALIASNKIFDSMAYEYLMFAGIVYVAILIFAILALRYKYEEIDTKKNDEIVNSVDKTNDNDEKFSTRL
ncbi:hypothetical protein PVAND_014651 [Polypedilum vanderplanki]|uniref:Uncharacterized protein n=1 Tax=Polypedilum vanderplanki TaxID=319348 RepID=A0A9J6BAT6_POLVA|nr:hypothetical protein PVAND_014651 [Polypedilum vanderplanki]